MAASYLSKDGSPLMSAATHQQVTAGQLALAWLLHHSPVMLPIPGTSSVEHLDENIAAAAIALTPEEIAAIG